MDAWIEALKQELGLDISFDKDLILDIAREAAHAVERPAAPVTTFLLGYAVAQGADPKVVASAIEKLAQQWPAKP